MRPRSSTTTGPAPLARRSLDAILYAVGLRADTPSLAPVLQALATVPIAKGQFIGDDSWPEFSPWHGTP